MIFTLNFHEFLHTMYKYMLNSVVTISLMFAQYFEYYGIIRRGGPFFRGHTLCLLRISLLSFLYILLLTYVFSFCRCQTRLIN